MTALNVPALKQVLHALNDATVGVDLGDDIDAIDQEAPAAEKPEALAAEEPPEGFEEVPGQPGTFRRIR